MKGRKPNPATRQQVAGDPRKYGTHKLEEKAAAQQWTAEGLPECPKHLKGKAREAWVGWSEDLALMKLDRRPDARMLEGACMAYATVCRAQVKLDEQGEVVEEPLLNRQGEVVGYKMRKNPWVSVRDASLMIEARFCSEFYLTPASNARRGASRDDGPKEDLAAILAAPRERRPVNTVN